MSTKKDHRLVYNASHHDALIKQFVNAVEKEFKLPINSCFQKRMFRTITDLRKSIFYVLYNHFKISTNEIGAIFFKDHATVLHGKRTILDLIEFDSALREKHKRILELSKFYLPGWEETFLNNIPQYGWHSTTINEIQKAWKH